MYFKHKNLKHLVCKKAGGKYDTAPSMPYDLMAKRKNSEMHASSEERFNASLKIR